MQDQNIGGKGF